MAIYQLNSEEEVIAFKTIGNTLVAYDVVEHKEIPFYFMEVILRKHFPTRQYEAINTGTSLYSLHGHSSTLVL